MGSLNPFIMRLLRKETFYWRDGIVLLLGMIGIAHLSGKSDVARADLPYRITTSGELGPDVGSDELVKVDGAAVVFRDRAALERDFPVVRGMSDIELDRWIINEFGFISRTQLTLSGIRNTKIPIHQTVQKMAFRPPGWNRAAVISVSSDGAKGHVNLPMVDIKGIGYSPLGEEEIKDQLTNFLLAHGNTQAQDLLRTKGHSDGLMSLGEAIAETTRQRAAQALFDEKAALQKAGARLETVETYFVIKLPFSILKDDGKQIQAALYGRQAHAGRTFGYPVPSDLYTDSHGGLQSDGFRKAAVDFGGVSIEDNRVKGNFGSLIPGEPFNAQKSRAWVYGHDVAHALVGSETHDQEIFQRHLQEMLGPIRSISRPDALTPVPFAQELQTLLEHGDEPLRAFAANYLRGEQTPRTLDLIALALRDQSLSVRFNAARALKGKEGPDWKVLMKAALNDTSVDVQKAAIWALQDRRDAESFKIIKDLIQKKNFDLTIHAIVALRGRQEPGSLKIIKELLKDPRFQQAASDALRGRQDPEALPLLKEILANGKTSVRLNVIAALQMRSDPASAALLEEALKDRKLEVKLAAAQSRQDPISLEILKQGLDSTDPFLRQQSAAGLLGRRDPESLAILRRALEDPDSQVRQLAAFALGSRFDAESLFLAKQITLKNEQGMSAALMKGILSRKKFSTGVCAEQLNNCHCLFEHLLGTPN